MYTQKPTIRFVRAAIHPIAPTPALQSPLIRIVTPPRLTPHPWIGLGEEDVCIVVEEAIKDRHVAVVAVVFPTHR